MGPRITALHFVRAVAAIGALAAVTACASPEAAPDAEQAVGSREAPREASVDLDHRAVHYTDVGQGPDTLVLVHGWAADRSVFDAQVAALSDRWRLLVVDLPGHGASEVPDEAFTMDLFARALAGVMDDAGVERATLIGHSNGVPVVRQFYRRWPERVRSLVLIDGAFRNVIPEELAAAFIELYTAPGYRERADGLADQMLATIPEELRPPLREVMLATPPETLAGGIEAAVDPSIWAEDPIEVATLCILAEQPMWTADYVAWIPELIPGVELHVWSGASHYLHVEDSERFHAVLVPFLEAGS